MHQTSDITMTTSPESPIEAYLLKCDIRAQNMIFHRAIRQVIVLNEGIVNLQARYDRARTDNRKSVRYSTRLRLCAIEGARNMFYEFAAAKCAAIERLQERLRDVAGVEYNFTDEDSNFEGEESSDEDTSMESEWSEDEDRSDEDEDETVAADPMQGRP